jgi:hypothetical protein
MRVLSRELGQVLEAALRFAAQTCRRRSTQQK